MITFGQLPDFYLSYLCPTLLNSLEGWRLFLADNWDLSNTDGDYLEMYIYGHCKEI